MARMRMWLQRHPRIIDGAAAAAVFSLTVLVRLLAASDDHPLWMPVAVAAGMCTAFPLRRQRPVLVFAITVAAALVQWLLGLTLLLVDVMLFATLYNVASRCRWQIVAVCAGALEVGAVLAIVRWFPPGVGFDQLVGFGSATILIGSMWIWGNSVRTRRAYLAGVEERAAQAERERDTQAQLAADAERARIARELHDVVSHSLSVMVVQADGAGYAINTDAGQAKQAVATIAGTGRNALVEMSRMLGVLRNQDEHDRYRPQPGIPQLDQLSEQMRQAGLPVEYLVDGDTRRLPAGIGLTVYRIVQEALTNTLKHAGPSVNHVQVRLSYRDQELQVRIRDDGRGAAARTYGPANEGNGLLGMRERAASHHGTVRSGPRDGGGYEVLATLPLPYERR